ncbi:MAG: uracil phosphoribosyltransferase [Myxococcota bacterium]
MYEQAYNHVEYRLSEMEHHYGPHVHLLADPVLLTQLARLCQDTTHQPDITWLVRDLYESLVRVVIANELPQRQREIQTRMHQTTPRGVWCGATLAAKTRVVTVNIARAGTLPSQIAFEALTRLLNPQNVRQDHLYMNRVTNAQGEVTGVNMSGSKIGGDVDHTIVLFPDPMGATGGSLSRATNLYRQLEGGSPMKLITLSLIVTPEFIRRMSTENPDVIIYAIRLDRGTSDAALFKTALGESPDESGLDEHQYIVPGAGGLGEILNNSYV